MNIGKFTIKAVETGPLALDGGAMFGVVPKNLWAKAYDAGDAQNRIPMASRPLLIMWGDRKVLVDAGSGTKMNEKLNTIYNIDTAQADLAVGLALCGLKPEDITDVIFTHLHFDHAGGATISVNDSISPLFPHAKHYVQKEQYEWALNPSIKDRASFMNENYVPLREAGLLELLDGEGDIFPGISVSPIYGHTKAMQVVTVRDAGQSAVFPADLAPTAAHIRAPFVMGYDNFPLTTIDEKAKHFARIYEEKSILILEHDAFRQAAILGSDEKGFYPAEEISIGS